MKPSDLLDRAARGNVTNVRFGDLENLVLALGFRLVRIRGSTFRIARGKQSPTKSAR